MNSFDVRVYAIRRRTNRRRPFEVRWYAAGRAHSKSFLTRGLADSYRAELVRAARTGVAFDPANGEPACWHVPEPPATTWLEHAIAYSVMKWPHLAPHSRASMADALATVTPALTRPTPGRPAQQAQRDALYGRAFTSHRQGQEAGPAAAAALRWLERASLPVRELADPSVARRALDALTVRLDGQRAAATTIARKRAVLHDALSHAVEAGLLSANPLSRLKWRAPTAVTSVTPQLVPSPAQVREILNAVAAIRPDLTAFFGCLYYAALRPEEAVALRTANLVLPAYGWGRLILTGACPRTGTAWTGTGSPYESRGLKHRPDGAIRVVPIPPVLIALLTQHLDDHGSAADGRLFRGSRGGMLSESVYGRAWHAARTAALGPALAGTPLGRRPYDLRHAALSLWLGATASPAEIAARAGNSVRVLHSTYAHCIDGHDSFVSQQIECALSDPVPSPSATSSGSANRSHQPPPVRHMSAAGKQASAQPRSHAGCPRESRAARTIVS